MSRRLVVVPRWGGHPASDWYPWLAAELDAIDPRPFDRVETTSMPDPDLPTVAAWVDRVREALGQDPEALSTTTVIGHSVGCQAVLRALAEFDDGVHVAGVLCVAGWFWVDEPWDAVVPWTDTPFDLSRSRAAAHDRIVALISDDDPFTADWQANAAAWRERLAATVEVSPGSRHFNAPQSPIVRRTLLDHLCA
jgi:uncharacterized protein